MLLGATLLMSIAGGILMHGMSVFFIPIRQELKLSTANTSLLFTISRAQGSAGAAIVGWLVDKFGGRPLIIVGTLLAGFGLIGIHRIEGSLPFILVFILIIAPGTHIGFGQTLLTAVNRWFVRRKALAFTILLMGASSGGALFVFPLGLGVEHLGWRTTFLYSGIFMLIAGLGLSLLIHHSPEKLGITAEDADELAPVSDSKALEEESSATVDFRISDAFKTKVFWILLAASTLRISAETGIMIHIIPVMVWKGLDEQSAAGLASLFFFLSIPTRLIFGLAGQKLPFQPLITTGMVCAVIGLLLVVTTEGTWSLYFFVFLFSIYEGSVILQWLAVGNYFGRSSYGTLTGIMRTFDTVGSLAAPFYAGKIFDDTGSYGPSLTAFAVMLGMCAVLYAISRKPKPPKGEIGLMRKREDA